MAHLMSAFGGKADIEAKLLTRDEARRIAVHRQATRLAAQELRACTIEELNACFVVTLSKVRLCFYFEDEPGRARSPSLEKHNHARTHAAS